MITFDGVTKRYPDGTVAVSELSLTVEEGQIAVFVGPSGCGKTTSMRMVNRMIEPTSGTITVDGRDVLDAKPADLRRGIGYVIQQIGLFPHRTTAQNIATVPDLLGWGQARTRARVAELMELVGLPDSAGERYPHQLSGGQRQRVGVARALAVDPPIMLMDEPFGAVDPLVRSRLQEEFLSLQSEVRKTIIFVTHDIDEAITMGDRVAILAEGGQLQQYDTPERILAEPANDFVADFLGAERGLKRLALIPVSEASAEPGPVVHLGAGKAEVERVAREADLDWVVVLDDTGMLRGWTWVEDVGSRVDDAPLHPFDVRVRATDSLRTALDALVISPTGVAVRVKALDHGDHYEGILTRRSLTQELA